MRGLVSGNPMVRIYQTDNLGTFRAANDTSLFGRFLFFSYTMSWYTHNLMVYFDKSTQSSNLKLFFKNEIAIHLIKYDVTSMFCFILIPGSDLSIYSQVLSSRYFSKSCDVTYCFSSMLTLLLRTRPWRNLNVKALVYPSQKTWSEVVFSPFVGIFKYSPLWN